MYLLTDKWAKLWYLQITEYYCGKKKDKFELVVEEYLRMHLECVILSEISQTIYIIWFLIFKM